MALHHPNGENGEQNRKNRVCLCLNGRTLAESLALLRAEPHFETQLDFAELRLDFLLDFSGPQALEQSLIRLGQDRTRGARVAGLGKGRGQAQFVLTLRRAADGGFCPDAPTLSDEQYLELLRRCVAVFSSDRQPIAYLDLDAPLLRRICVGSAELRDSCAALLEQLRGLGARLIISLHDFAIAAPPVLADRDATEALWDAAELLLSELGLVFATAAESREWMAQSVLKLALMATNSREVLHFYYFAQLLRCRQQALKSLPSYILLAMGESGSSSRVLSAHVGSLWTFCTASASAGNEPVAPGQLSFAELIELYRYRDLGPGTKVYGVVGNPVGHSRSPEIHNPIYQQKGWNAVYLRFRADELSDFLALSDFLPLRGISCTVPHKEALARLALSGRIAGKKVCASRAVQLLGAGNTLYLSAGEDGSLYWLAENTDVEGFIRPLLDLCRQRGIDLRGKKAAVIGAGGAARAAVYALLREGVDCAIYNRSPEKARQFQTLFNNTEGLSGKVLRADSLEEGATIGPDCDLLVQTTSVGMSHAGANTDAMIWDPVPRYSFRPAQIAYDLIYQPERTVFLQRAEAAGALVLNGSAMLRQQALAQIELFAGSLPDNTNP